jgi:S1-C subfamily serine protease
MCSEPRIPSLGHLAGRSSAAHTWKNSTMKQGLAVLLTMFVGVTSLYAGASRPGTLPSSSASLASDALITASGRDQIAGDVYELYRRVTIDQANENPLIGIWSGSLCAKPILLAVIRNDEKNGFDLKAVLLNGKEVGYGFKDADPWFYVSPLAVAGVYQGKTVYRNRLFKNWYPNRIVMMDENIFSASDDARNSCGPATNVYVRKEPRPKSAAASHPMSGSGFLLGETAFIMTAYHVVREAKHIEVRFSSGDTYSAQMVASDMNNDLAVLKLVNYQVKDAGFTMNVNSSLSAGDLIHVLGFPLSSTLGEQASIVSGEVSSTTGIDGSPTQFRITAPINSGNSGGPILNPSGEVVGIVVSSLVGRGVENVNFGLKTSTALPLLQQVGLGRETYQRGKPMTASQIFATLSKNVVLVNTQ